MTIGEAEVAADFITRFSLGKRDNALPQEIHSSEPKMIRGTTSRVKERELNETSQLERHVRNQVVGTQNGLDNKQPCNPITTMKPVITVFGEVVSHHPTLCRLPLGLPTL